MTGERCLYWRAKESRWRVHLVRQGHHLENHFSVNEYGSRQTARPAALRWRDELYASLPHRKIKLRERRNRSGIIGIKLSSKTNPSGKQYWSWVAEWREGGRTLQRKFSILKYGDYLARSLAAKTRQHGIAEIRSHGKATPTE